MAVEVVCPPGVAAGITESSPDITVCTSESNNPRSNVEICWAATVVPTREKMTSVAGLNPASTGVALDGFVNSYEPSAIE